MIGREEIPVFATKPPSETKPSETNPRIDWQRWAIVYSRIALGAAFLSAVSSRVGLRGKGFHESFADFISYTAQVNSFMPASTIPFLAWAATVAETTLGVLLIVGVWTRWVAWASAILLAMFGIAMAISFGIKSPLDYSVFSASAAAAMIGVLQSQRQSRLR